MTTPRTRRTLVAATCVLSVLLLSAGPVSAQTNSLSNPNFDVDLSGWDPAPAVISATPDAMDVDDDPASGSVRQENLNDDGGLSGGLSQCHSVVAGEAYTFRHQSYTPSGQAATGRADFNGFWRDGDDCQGGSVGAVAGMNGPFGVFDEWVETVGVSMAPPSARSVRAVLVTRKFDAAGTFATFYDAVELLPEPHGMGGVGLVALAVLAARRRRHEADSDERFA